MIRFHYPLAVFIIIPVTFSILYYLRPKGAKAILLVASRLAVISVIFLFIASPYTEEYVQTMGTAGLTIIEDRTESMRLFPPSDEAYSYFANMTQPSVDYISGTDSPIGDAIIRNVKPGGSILLISDGNNNHGKSIPEAVSFARSLNTTVYYLRQEPIKKDMSVSIEGYSVSVIDTQANFDINTMAVGDIEGDLKVWIDGKVVSNEHITGSKKIPVAYSFTSTGSHIIKAELAAKDDEIQQNNVFYRTVHVIPAPGVLHVSYRDSPLSRIMKSSYSVNFSSSPAEASMYKAVVLDDISASALSFSDSLTLSDYVINGGGLVVVGGQEAYSDYGKLPLFEQLIPVKYGGVPPKKSKTAVVIIIDISGSTGDLSGSAPKLGIEKGLSLQVLEGLGAGDFIGVIAFNNAPHTILPLARYADRSKAGETIQALRYGGTTHLDPALNAARDMLKGFEGGRNIIVISDGAVADGEGSIRTARSMSDDGITVYAIGVGWDTDRDFMTSLAEAGNGGYLERDAAHGIRLLFGEKEARDRGDGFPLDIINSGHFITKDVTVNATVYGYNNVYAKQNAQVLVMTGNGNPVVTSWRAGLGRVVSVTVDDGTSWAPELYGEGNSKLVTNSINYAIGNPDGLTLRAADGEAGEPMDIAVTSGSEPVFTFDGEKMQFKRTGENSFHSVVYPNTTGFHDISGYAVAVNEPSEYRYIGNNELMPGIIKGSGGQIYNVPELGRLITDMNNERTGIIINVIDLRPAFLLLALLLYSSVVIFRRLMELLRIGD